jgi:2-haloacid dehalogenase
LLHALAESDVDLRKEDIDGLMKAYDSLSTFPDVIPALKSVASNPNITAVVFSNGTQSMVSNSVFHSQDLSPHAGVFHDLVTVDEVKKYKPAPEVYLHLAEKVGKQKSQMGDMWLVTGNPFDVVGARNMGMKAAWVDRAGRGWQDAAIPGLPPTVIGGGLEEIVRKITEHQRSG